MYAFYSLLSLIYAIVCTCDATSLADVDECLIMNDDLEHFGLVGKTKDEI